VIAYLRGNIVEKGADHVVLDVSGVGYLVSVSMQTLAALPQTGRDVELLISAQQAQDGPLSLYGFASADERSLFEQLITVHGIGPKLARDMLSGMGFDELATAIAAGNVARLRAIKGVGPKTAERVLLELRGKVRPSGRVPGAEPAAPAPTPPDESVVRALVGLGYRLAEAEQAVGAAQTRVPGARTDHLLREALKQIQAR